MKKLPTRVIIYAKDVENITGRSRRTAQVILRQIKSYFKKAEKDLVTIMEFCAYMKLEEELVKEFLVD
jgi:hypothetical protein